MGFPEPLKTRPSMSRDTGVFSTCTQAAMHPTQQHHPLKAQSGNYVMGWMALLLREGDAYLCVPAPVSMCTQDPSCCTNTQLPKTLTSPVNSKVVFLLSMPEVPSNTCTTALVPSTSST